MLSKVELHMYVLLCCFGIMLHRDHVSHLILLLHALTLWYIF